MNKSNIQQIFKNYIDKFDLINNEEHNENFKWFTANQFKPLMNHALSASDDDFADALNEVKKCTGIITDNKSIQPFGGLVAYARKEPDTVRNMFLNLYSDDGGDLHVQERLIREFLIKCKELHDRYAANSYRYEQNSHSVSAYLFLYDPDHHYMYKASQSKNFADCIEFYEDWGSGDNIKLDVYYKMCDWICEQIMSSEELLSVDATRFERMDSEGMFPDTNKHLLVFDLIYCCDVYDLFYDIPFEVKNSKQKKEYLENQAKARELYVDYLKAEKDNESLEEALKALDGVIEKGTKITHKTFGAGEVMEYKNRNMTVQFKNGVEKKLSAPATFGNELASLDNEKDMIKVTDFASILKREKSVKDHVKFAENALEPYKDYID